MVGQRAVNPWLRQVGSIPTSRTKFCPISIMVLRLFCNQVTAVRFCHGAPINVVGGRPIKTEKRLCTCGASFIGCSASGMSLRLGRRFRKFDSSTTDQFYGLVVLMGTHLVCNQKLRVRFSPGPPSFASVDVEKAEHRKLCKVIRGVWGVTKYQLLLLTSNPAGLVLKGKMKLNEGGGFTCKFNL